MIPSPTNMLHKSRYKCVYTHLSLFHIPLPPSLSIHAGSKNFFLLSGAVHFTWNAQECGSFPRCDPVHGTCHGGRCVCSCGYSGPTCVTPPPPLVLKTSVAAVFVEAVHGYGAKSTVDLLLVGDGIRSALALGNVTAMIGDRPCIAASATSTGGAAVGSDTAMLVRCTAPPQRSTRDSTETMMVNPTTAYDTGTAVLPIYLLPYSTPSEIAPYMPWNCFWGTHATLVSSAPSITYSPGGVVKGSAAGTCSVPPQSSTTAKNSNTAKSTGSSSPSSSSGPSSSSSAAASSSGAKSPTTCDQTGEFQETCELCTRGDVCGDGTTNGGRNGTVPGCHTDLTFQAGTRAKHYACELGAETKAMFGDVRIDAACDTTAAKSCKLFVWSRGKIFAVFSVSY